MISRERCINLVSDADLDWHRGFCLDGETNRFEALINRAYAEGQKDFQVKAIHSLEQNEQFYARDTILTIEILK